MDIDLILQFGAVYVIVNGLAFFYFNQRLNAQDKYITTYFQSFASHKDITLPPRLDTREVNSEEVKPQVYSPRHDVDSVMSGKVIDPFD